VIVLSGGGTHFTLPTGKKTERRERGKRETHRKREERREEVCGERGQGTEDR
jgi:hypothetical protein